VKNIDLSVENDVLTLKIDLTKDFGLSKSGKTVIIASTEGNITVEDHNVSSMVKLGVNCYKYPDD
jgi:hypothetical protein